MAETLKFDAKLEEGIAYFEQMLDVLPDDRTTLEFLVVAYGQRGEKAKEESALARLASLLAKEGDLVALAGLLPRLEAASDPQAKVMFLRAKALTAPPPDLTPEAPKEKSEEEIIAEIKQSAIKSEKSLADILKDDGVLSEEEYKNVISHLDASVGNDRVFLISALQILEKENSTLCEKAIAALADKFETPPISLSSYEIRGDLFAGLPVNLLRICGVVPFARLGQIMLFAILNPSDGNLRSTISNLSPNCRFYLADPAAIESVLSSRFSETQREGL